MPSPIRNRIFLASAVGAAALLASFIWPVSFTAATHISSMGPEYENLNREPQPEGKKRCLCRAEYAGGGAPIWCAPGQLSNPGMGDVSSQYFTDPQYTATAEECLELCNSTRWGRTESTSDISYTQEKRGQDWDWGDSPNTCPYYVATRPSTEESVAAGVSGCQPILPDNPGCVQVGSTTLSICICKYPDDFENAFCRGKTVVHPNSSEVMQAGPTPQQGCQAGCANVVAPDNPLNGKRLEFAEVYQPTYTTEFERCSFPYAENCQKPAPSPTAVGYQAPSYDKCTKDEMNYCFCKYREPAICKGLPVYISTLQGPDEVHCRGICDYLKMDYHKVVKDTNEVCWYDASEQRGACKFPVNQGAPACQGFLEELQKRQQAAAQSSLEAQQAARERQINAFRGTPTSLSLPLGTTSPQRIIGRAISAILGVVGGLALLAFVYGGIVWMTAAGNPDRVAKAKSTVIWASIGLVGIFSAYALLNFLLSAFAQ